MCFIAIQPQNTPELILLVEREIGITRELGPHHAILRRYHNVTNKTAR